MRRCFLAVVDMIRWVAHQGLFHFQSGRLQALKRSATLSSYRHSRPSCTASSKSGESAKTPTMSSHPPRSSVDASRTPSMTRRSIAFIRFSSASMRPSSCFVAIGILSLPPVIIPPGINVAIDKPSLTNPARQSIILAGPPRTGIVPPEPRLRSYRNVS
jgi:hypothetical protein